MAMENPTKVSPTSSRCTQCNTQQKKNTRNLVVCIDGTSNQFGRDDTNVAKLFTQIDLKSTRPEQRTYYSSGIGTHPKLLDVLSRLERAVSDKLDMAIALNIDKIVKHAYGWLVENYEDGDQIYLFGFSRGAYQVRVLAGMIHEVGLIREGTDGGIETAYNYYRTICSGKSKTRPLASEFRDALYRNPKVHFVGVWDTVSSAGLVRGDVFPSSPTHACHFRHALALDEFRVKFMPEYFHKLNLPVDHGTLNEQHVPSLSGNGADIKEVWFAGSHSDVGGQDRHGKSYRAGNVSLLWMRREAVAKGLVLEPTDLVWLPNDIDLGVRNSMSKTWRAIEYLPITHQVSFSGAGGDDRRLHLFQPRRIIPGQKIHDSVLYANTYRPKATIGECFDIPIIQSRLEDTELDDEVWETGFFDDTAAQQLVTYLVSQKRGSPLYLDRLLFMLRFDSGRQYVRNVVDWKDKFTQVINDDNRAMLVRLVAIVAYHELTCHSETTQTICVPFPDGSGQGMLDNESRWLSGVLATHRHIPTAVALLRALTKHQVFHEVIFRQHVVDELAKLLDMVIEQPRRHFGQVMDVLSCLLQCDHNQRILVVRELEIIPTESKVSRLSRILEVRRKRYPYDLVGMASEIDLDSLTSALRMVLTLARISKASAVWSSVKHRIVNLAGNDDPQVGSLAVEILLVLYNPNDRDQLDIRKMRVRTNLTGLLVYVKLDSSSSIEDRGCSVDPDQASLSNLFGLHAQVLNEDQKKRIGILRMAVEIGDLRDRTSATMALLKLCEVTAIRSHLWQIKLPGVFVAQMRHKDRALLAAYALATCLRRYGMQQQFIDVLRGYYEDLSKHIVGMLILDYFDDAIGLVEGFLIFKGLMQHAELREKVKRYDVLNTKLGKDNPKATRTSLICLEIFQSFDSRGPLTDELFDKSLKYLEDPVEKVRQAGVTILSVLAQTKHGVVIIQRDISRVVDIFLRNPQTQMVANPSSSGDSQPVTETTGVPPKLHSWMVQAAHALCILAQDVKLRSEISKTEQYVRLKELHLSGMFTNGTQSRWRLSAPNRVVDMLDKAIKVIDGELSDGVTLIGNSFLPALR